jgi:hypothetical protein
MIDALSAVQKEGLNLVPEVSSDAITVKMSGSCDSQTMVVLDRFLASLHLEVMRIGAKSVVLDCENLYFMNSSALKCFVTWLTKVKAIPPPDRYHVSVHINRFLAWQQRSFGAICRSAPDVLSVHE